MTQITNTTSTGTGTSPTPATAPTRPRRRCLPTRHPARILGHRNPDGTYPYLDVEITGGWTNPDQPTLTHWTADLTAVHHGHEDHTTPVATMTLTVVDPTAGLPGQELAALDEDAAELGDMLFFGQARTPHLHALAPDDGAPVLLVNTFTVDNDWRGTLLTPILALRVLKIFANLGLRTAALHAAPMADDMTPADRTRIGVKIERMWATAGFTNLDTHSGFMAMTFTRATLDDTLTALTGTHRALRAAADRW